MRRRLLISAFACSAAGRALGQEDRPGTPHQKVSAEELRRALASRFPAYLGLPGVVDVRVDAPRLLLLPARQRVGATVSARLRDLVAGQVHEFEMDWVFALRYEPADRTVRAHDLEILDLRSAELPPSARRDWQQLLGGLARGAVGEIVLHRFSHRELALPESLGFEPRDISVVEDGLVIWFGR